MFFITITSIVKASRINLAKYIFTVETGFKPVSTLLGM